MKQEDAYLAAALETFFQFMDRANPVFNHEADHVEYEALRNRIRPLVQQHRQNRPQGDQQGTTAPVGGQTR